MSTSWASHVKSKTHSDSLELRARNQQVAIQARDQYANLYHGNTVSLAQPSRIQIQPAPLPTYSSSASYGDDVNGINSSDFSFDMIEQDHYFGIPAVDTPVEDAIRQEQLALEIDRLRLATLDEEFEGAEDVTVPCMAEEFRALGLNFS